MIHEGTDIRKSFYSIFIMTHLLTKQKGRLIYLETKCPCFDIPSDLCYIQITSYGTEQVQ